MAIEVGSIVEGVVTSIKNFGAFVQLPEGKTGLIHISEVADVYVKDIKDHIKENDKVKVKVISVDENGKIGLSIKQLNPKSPNSRPPRRDGWRNSQAQMSFEEKISKFLKDSEERQSDLKKNTDAKRRGGWSRGEY